MVKIKVQNVPGTAGQTPPYPYNDYSWLEYWEKKTGQKALFCACCSCMKKAEHGAHVKMCDTLDVKTYIVPLCSECNNPNNKEPFYVDCKLCPIY